MKKLLLVLLVVLLASPCFGAVGTKNQGSMIGTATDIDFSTGMTATSDGSTTTVTAGGAGTALTPATVVASSYVKSYSTIFSAGFNAGVSTNVSTASSLTASALSYGAIAMQGATTAKTIGIADGNPGQMIKIYMSEYNGANITIDKASFPAMVHSTGWTSIVFSAVNQSVVLLWLDNTYGWVLVGQPTAATFHTVASASTITAGTTISAGTSVAAGTTVNAGTTITAGTGITATAGNATINAGNVLFQSNTYASGMKQGVSTMVSTASSLTTASLSYGVYNKQAGSAETVGLGNGVVGQIIKIRCATYGGGNFVVAVNGDNLSTKASGWSSITYTAAGQWATLLYLDDTNGWIIIGQNGVTIAS